MDRKDLIKILKEDGWYMVGQTGGHCMFRKEGRADKITVPYKIKKNIELSVLRQAGLKHLRHKK